MFLLAFKLLLLVFHSNTKKETNQSPFLNLSFKYGFQNDPKHKTDCCKKNAS